MSYIVEHVMSCEDGMGAAVLLDGTVLLLVAGKSF